MELDQFIEQDLRRFLDEQLLMAGASQAAINSRKDGVFAPEDLSIYAPGRDYARELEIALHDRDYAKAQRIIEDLKIGYERYPSDAPERSEAQQLLAGLYRTYRAAREREAPTGRGASSLTSLLPDLDPPRPSWTPSSSAGTSIDPGPSPSFASPPAAVRPPVSSPPLAAPSSSPPLAAPSSSSSSPSSLLSSSPFSLSSAPRMRTAASSVAISVDPHALEPSRIPPRLAGEEERALHADIEQVFALIDEKEYLSAIRAYKEVRHRLSLEQCAPDERTRILLRLTEAYRRIHAAIADAHVPGSVTGAEQGAAERRHADSDLLHRLQLHLEEAESALIADDTAEAMRAYHAARNIYRGLDDAERTRRHERLAKIHAAITERMGRQHHAARPGQQTLDHEEQKLVGRP